MFKFLLVVCIIGMGLIYLGNYLDLRRNKISRKEYDRRIRIFVVLGFILLAIVVYLKKR